MSKVHANPKPAADRVTICPVCGNRQGCGPRYRKHGYQIRFCPKCGLMFVDPRPSPDAICDIYNESYFKRGRKYAGCGHDPAGDPNRINDRKKMSILGRYRPAGRLLDIGCAMGGFLQTAREHPYQVCGVEISAYAATYACRELRLDVKNTSLENAAFASGSFDIVTMWDVLEHLPEPCRTLQEVYRVLKPGGILAFSTGDSGSRWARATGRYWPLLTPPQHLFFFTMPSIRQLLHRSCFVLQEARYLPKQVTLEFLLFKALETLGISNRFIQDRWGASGLLSRRVAVNLGDIVTCIARKKQ